MVQLHFKATLAKSCLEQKLSGSSQIFPDELAQITIDFTKENGKVQYTIKGPAEIADKIRAVMLEP
jgi:hypothetical protein